MSTSKNTENPGLRLVPESPDILNAIGTAMDLLEAAGGLTLLREILVPESREYEHATEELKMFLVCARVSVADAISHIEDDES